MQRVQKEEAREAGSKIATLCFLFREAVKPDNQNENRKARAETQTKRSESDAKGTSPPASKAAAAPHDKNRARTTARQPHNQKQTVPKQQSTRGC